MAFGYGTLQWGLAGLLWLTLAGGRAAGQERLPLAGEWRFALDRAEAGLSARWFTNELPERITLPGILQAQGFGDEISTNTPWVLSLYDRLWFQRADYQAHIQPGQVRVPFVSQPPRHYLGAAWYQRDIEIPTNWTGKRILLFLERPRWESRVWVGDTLIGTNDSLCVPHEYDLGVNLTPGKHTLTVRVDNRMLMPYRPDAHSVSDSLAQSWNGIVGNMELRAHDAVWIERVELKPDMVRHGVAATIFTRNDTGEPVPARLVFLQVTPKNFGGNALKPMQETATLAVGRTNLTFFYSLGDQFESWSEFRPRIYSLRATIAGPGFRSSWEGTFGMRDFRAVGTDIVMNGRPTFLRGTHHGGDFPLTGYPPTDVAYWRKTFKTCKDWGLNHVRFHSYCPPEAAFTAADEIGLYLAIEPGMWNTFNPGSPMEDMLYRETERVLKAYGNHPSFVMIAASNEPKGRWKDVLPKWAEHFRALDPRRLYTTGTGFTDSDAPGPLDKVDYSATQRFGSRQIRGASGWFGGDYSRSLQGVNVPVVTHENGQWCAYPDFEVIKKFTGYMQPGNFEIFRDSAAENDVLKMNNVFAHASGRFQLECYKEEVEAALRTPGIAGFQLLDLHDYVGQGTALVGVLDPFWEEKSYVQAHEWRRFCSDTVPLARLNRRVFTAAETLTAALEVAHFGAEPLTNVVVECGIQDSGGNWVVRPSGVRMDLAIGRNHSPLSFHAELAGLPAPAAYRLVARAGGAENSWNFGLYPATVAEDPSPAVLVTRSWPEAEARLAMGGRVLFLPRNAELDWTSPPLDNLPVFWNRLMNPQWGRMLGLWCDTNHPALSAFPTAAHCDWQWTQLTKGARAVNLRPLPRELTPIVAAIDDWNRNWKLAPLFEARVGPGRLLVCSFDLTSRLSERVVARQLRRALLDYAAGEHFQPRVTVRAEELRALWFDNLIMRKLGATSPNPGATAAFDGDPNTFWSVGGRGRGADGRSHPHSLTVTFTNLVSLSGLIFMNRQNDRDHLGDIREYEVEASVDGQTWKRVAEGELESSWQPQRIGLVPPIEARHLRLTARTGFGADASAALAEWAVLYAGPPLPDVASEDPDYQRVRSTSADVEEGGSIPANPR